MMPSLPDNNSMARLPVGTVKWYESTYRTARLDSTIQPGREEVSPSRLVGRRTPRDSFLNIHGPSSKHKQLLDSYVVDDGPAGGVVLHAGVPEDHARVLRLGPERPRVRIPALHAVHGLQIYGLRRGGDGDVERLELGAGSGGAERDGVGRALLHLHLLADLGVVAQAHGVLPLRHDEDHRALPLARRHQLHHTVGFPAGDGDGGVGDRGVRREASRGRGLEIAIDE
ncbi:hydrogenase expression/formation protein HypC [Striga asiatica]|uniref:Hydrogenase expression/formation protein HypC n=1 Tax=Striga asiatica TaxID=4170 RepID=A0A5A7NWB1_STRAF|nr:hydrogenase expression/formation protein HypC [Striga asiatica]